MKEAWAMKEGGERLNSVGDESVEEGRGKKKRRRRCRREGNSQNVARRYSREKGKG